LMSPPGAAVRAAPCAFAVTPADMTDAADRVRAAVARMRALDTAAGVPAARTPPSRRPRDPRACRTCEFRALCHPASTRSPDRERAPDRARARRRAIRTPRPVRWTLVVRTAVAPLDARLLARALAAAVLSGGDTGAPRRHALAPGSARDGRSAARDPRAPLCAARQ
jgi:hypothetical protein